MEISKDIEIVNCGLFLRKERILIINDLHIGYEEALQQRGILVPRFQTKEIMELLEKMVGEVKPIKIILNGDVKHEFGKALKQEWREVMEVIDFLQKSGMEVIIVRGNHDPILAPIIERRGVKIVKEYRVRDILVVHGDKIVDV